MLGHIFLSCFCCCCFCLFLLFECKGSMCIRHVLMAQHAVLKDWHDVCACCSFCQTICNVFILGNPIQFDFAISLHFPNGWLFNPKSPICYLGRDVGTIIDVTCCQCILLFVRMGELEMILQVVGGWSRLNRFNQWMQGSLLSGWT